MPLDSNQSGPGNRISAPDGTEHDVVARIATDGGPYVILAPADGEGLVAGSLVSEGALRDHEDVAYVSTTAEAKAEAYKTQQDADAQQAKDDRQARIDRQHADAIDHGDTTTETTGTTGTRTD